MVNIDNSQESRKEPTLPRRGILKQSNNDNRYDDDDDDEDNDDG